MKRKTTKIKMNQALIVVVVVVVINAAFSFVFLFYFSASTSFLEFVILIYCSEIRAQQQKANQLN